MSSDTRGNIYYHNSFSGIKKAGGRIGSTVLDRRMLNFNECRRRRRGRETDSFRDFPFSKKKWPFRQAALDAQFSRERDSGQMLSSTIIEFDVIYRNCRFPLERKKKIVKMHVDISFLFVSRQKVYLGWNLWQAASSALHENTVFRRHKNRRTTRKHARINRGA